MDGMPISRLAEWLTTSSVSVISLKTLYRWKQRFRGLWGKWWIHQRKKWATDLQEGDGILSFYRQGMSSNEEIHLLLAYFFDHDRSIPRKGKLFSMINLRQPFGHWLSQ